VNIIATPIRGAQIGALVSWSLDRSSQRHPDDRRDMVGTTTSGGDGY
jgi:hypothetical protein